MIFVWIILIAAIIVVAKVLIDSSRKRESETRTPLDILKERYAAGDITRDEFEQKKQDLVER